VVFFFDEMVGSSAKCKGCLSAPTKQSKATCSTMGSSSASQSSSTKKVLNG
jgi:hypothetical protein